VAVHAEDEVAAADVGILGGRAVEHAQDLEAAPVLLDIHPDSLEVAAHLLRELVSLLGGQVVRIGIVQRLHDPLQRRVVELALVDGLVVVVLDRVDQLGAQRTVLLHERVAHRTGQVLGMAAEPQAGDERHQGADKCENASRHGDGG
jgi:hypothetical protein